MAANPDPLFETRAHGKFLLTGEYAVLDGALSLAIPLRYGQTLLVEAGETPGRLYWASFDQDDEVWFKAIIDLPALDVLQSSDAQTAELLQKILRHCRFLNPSFLADETSLFVEMSTDFPREWGLGTSSTLVAALARWAGVDPYDLLFETFGGSGYDIACAYAEEPILYRLENGHPIVQAAHFQPDFSDQLYFVFLGKKQDSRAGIQRYREKVRKDDGLIAAISALTERAQQAPSLAEFDLVLREHEDILSRTLELPRARDLYFADFWGEIKSLGAWGGDFVLATSSRSEAETRTFFNEKGFGVFMPWREMVFLKG